LLDTATGEFQPEAIKGKHGFGGIAWTRDGRTLYATGKARDGTVFVTRFDEAGKATATKPIEFPLNSRIEPNFAAKDSKPSGLALSPDEKTLYVSLFNNATLAVVDLTTYDPEAGGAKFTEVPVGSSPERVAVSPLGDKVYVANRGGKTPEAGDTEDTADPVVVDPETYKASTATLSVVSAGRAKADAAHAVVKTIDVGLQPADLALSPDGRFLYTANANAESVSVIRTADDTIAETIPTSPAPGKLAASSPNGLAVTPDGRTLYVTLGGDNAVEALALDAAAGGTAERTRIAGLIPTAWFPLGVALGKDAKTLYVANSKGIGSAGAIAKRKRTAFTAETPEAGPGGLVVGDDFVGHSVYAVMGSVGIVPVPDAKTLAQYTAQVARNNHFDRMEAALKQNTDPFWSRFKHVVLIIKENRTYDQILGDMPVPPGHVGGDPSLLMWGEKITPNQHAIAREFGLFDNIYCSGAISADGHHWLNEAFADDYDERAMNNYPRSYPCCGTDPLVYAGNPFLWQAAMQAGRTFYNYGEFGPLPSMKRHSDADFSGRFTVTEDRNRDVAHSERVLADLQPGARGLAQYTSIWFGNNHTSGIAPGAYTPESCVADNDMAVGNVVDAISHSKRYWQEEPTAIFIIEDDAQGGLDHVEGHRTTGFVISPFNKRGQTFSTNYNQLNMVRTIELMLDLKPLNQFDAAAVPMRPVFQETGDFRPFNVIKNRVALNLKNPPARRLTGTTRHWAEVSARLDFSKPDRADPEKVTQALWVHTHGDAAYPPADAAP
ncbi:MAG TPA: bifunctional YncE family protein/alkaline phosphatase family protein, partial [Chthonomonadaceae bacterium]|nr:bifunctional YncE family protein/alkaline phosphatase family protein [Chthonomonadaceae bacterium]